MHICEKQIRTIQGRYAQLKKEPTAQTAHVVFADTKANAEKTKRAVFCQRSNELR